MGFSLKSIDFSFPLEEELNDLGPGKVAQALGEGKRHEGILGHKQLLREKPALALWRIWEDLGSPMDSPHLLHLGFLLLALAAPRPNIAMSRAGPANSSQGRITTVYYCKDYKYCTCKKDQNDLKNFTRIAEIQNKRNTMSDVPVELVNNKSHITVCFEHAHSSPEGIYGLYSDETGQPKIWCGNLNSGGNGGGNINTEEKNVCCEAEAVAWNHNSHLNCYIQKSHPKPTSLPIAIPDEEILGNAEFLTSKSSLGILLAFLFAGVCAGWGTMFYFLRLRRRQAFKQDRQSSDREKLTHS